MEHQKIHTGDKPFVCKDYEKGFVKKKKIKTYKPTPENPYCG